MILSIERDSEIAVVTVDSPPVNALGQALRAALWDAVGTLDADPSVKAVVLICAGRTFIAGADITEFGKPPVPPDLPEVVDRIEGAAKPWIAAIHGSALGGGFEVAMGCRFRVALDSASIGLPEVTLGIVPGASGTVRTPRLAGVEAAVELVTTGRPVKAAKALSMGLVDKVVTGDLRAEAVAFARDVLTRPLPQPISARPVSSPDATWWDEQFKAVAKRVKGEVAPLKALECLRVAAEKPFAEAMVNERATFTQLRISDQSKALRYIFFAERGAPRPAHLADVKPLPIRAAAVIGGGTMGAGIAAALRDAGLPVTLIERDQEAVERGLANLRSIFQGAVKRGKMTEAEARSRMDGVKAGTDYALALTVLAFAAPLASVVGVLPLVIMFAGIGAPLAFAMATVVLLLFSVGYTAMSRYLPNPGAFYAYISAGMSKVLGLAASFLAILGYLMIGLGIAIFFGIVAEALVTSLFGASPFNWFPYTLGLIVLVGLLGYLRIDLSAKVLSVVMFLELAIVLLFDLVVGVNGGPEGLSAASFHWGSITEGAVGVSILFAVLTFLGFEATAIFREETRNPTKTVPQATYLAVGFIGVFYVITTWLMITAYGNSKAVEVAGADPTAMFTKAMETFVGAWAGQALSVLVVTSAFAAVLSCQNIIARYCFSLGHDRVLPAVLGKVHPRHGSPYVASLLLTAVMLVGVLIFSTSDPNTTYAWLAGAGGFPLLILMLLTSISVFVFFLKNDGADTHVTVWQSKIAPALAAIGLAAAVYMAATNFVDLTGGSAPIAMTLQVIIWSVFAIGILLGLFYRSKKPAIYARIGRQPIA